MISVFTYNRFDVGRASWHVANGNMTSLFSPQMLDHFEHPRNSGELAAPGVKVRVENPACGDIMELSLRIADGAIAESRYRTRGCVAAIACGSALTEMLAGLSLSDAALLQREAVATAVGGLRPESVHASHLVMDALHQALQQAKV